MKLFYILTLFFFISINTFAQSPILTLPFNGNANDVSGYGNNGILGGGNLPYYVPDRFGNANSAIQLGGCGNLNWVRVPNSASLQFAYRYSASLWFKQCDFAGMDGWGNCVPYGGLKIIFAKAGDAIAANPAIYCGASVNASNKLTVSNSNKNCWGYCTANFSADTTFDCVDTCQWVHMVVVIDSNQWKMYFNGQLRKQVTIATPDFSGANAQDLYFGRMYPGNWYPYGGTIDDVNFYNYALSQAQIDSLYGNYYNNISPANPHICLGQSVALNANSGSVFSWTPSATLNVDTGTVVIATPTVTTTYVVNYTNPKGCITQASTTVYISDYNKDSITHSMCIGNSFFGHTTTGNYIDTVLTSTGCHQIHYIHLTVNPKTYSTFTNTICQGQNYMGYTATGMYKDTFVNANGCDSVRTINLTVNPRTYSTFTDTICQGQTYLGYTTSGIKKDTFINANGCDSIRTLNLTVHPKTFSTITDTICQGQSYLGYTTSGTKLDTFINANGCDSIRTINLTVNPRTYKTIIQTICQGATYLGHSTSGIYIDTFVNAKGCDSIRTINLTVNARTFSTINKTICQPATYLGHFIAGTYTDTILNANGCDSIRTLHLTVNIPTASTLYDTICQGQSFVGYTATGIYIDTLQNTKGCDSIRTIHLLVKNKTYSSITKSICQGQNYLGYTTTGIFKDTFVNANGCDSIRTINLTVMPTYFKDTTVNICAGQYYFCANALHNSSGIYWDSLHTTFGCDSITKTTLIVNPLPQPNLGNDIEICAGETATLNAVNFNYYNWNNGSNAQSISTPVAGTYYVQVANILPCYGYDTIKVTVHPKPVVTYLWNSHEICSEDTIKILGQGATNLTWYFNNNIVSNNALLQYVATQGTYPFTLIGATNFGCKDTTELTVQVIDCCGSYYMPTAFSPNADGVNDIFEPKGSLYPTSYSLQIFNRFGEKIFETNDRNMGWNGYYKGLPCDIGVYEYLVRSKCDNNPKETITKGDVLLVR